MPPGSIPAAGRTHHPAPPPLGVFSSVVQEPARVLEQIPWLGGLGRGPAAGHTSTSTCTPPGAAPSGQVATTDKAEAARQTDPRAAFHHLLAVWHAGFFGRKF